MVATSTRGAQTHPLPSQVPWRRPSVERACSPFGHSPSWTQQAPQTGRCALLIPHFASRISPGRSWFHLSRAIACLTLTRTSLVTSLITVKLSSAPRPLSHTKAAHVCCYAPILHHSAESVMLRRLARQTSRCPFLIPDCPWCLTAGVLAYSSTVTWQGGVRGATGRLRVSSPRSGRAGPAAADGAPWALVWRVRSSPGPIGRVALLWARLGALCVHYQSPRP